MLGATGLRGCEHGLASILQTLAARHFAARMNMETHLNTDKRHLIHGRPAPGDGAGGGQLITMRVEKSITAACSSARRR